MLHFYKIRIRIYAVALLVCCISGLVMPVAVVANDSINIAVVLSKDSPPYQSFYTQLKLKLALLTNKQQRINISLIRTDISQATSTLFNPENYPDFIVSTGTHAAEELIKIDTSIPIIFSLIPGTTYQHKIQTSLYCKNKNLCSAIYLEQPIERQFSIIKQLLPELKQLGIILGPVSARMQDNIVRAGEKYNVKINVRLAKETDNMVLLSDQLSQENDALLAIPDAAIYNRRTAKGILLSTYKHQTPFIGYSHGFVRAGALFSIYSTPKQIATQTAEMLTQILLSTNNKRPFSEYPDSYKVEINPAVMRSLRAKVNFDSSKMDQIESGQPMRQPHE